MRKTKFILLVLCVTLIVCPAVVSALEITLDTEFSNFDPPLAGHNFGTVTLTQVDSSVVFEIVLNTGVLGSGADLQWFYFNVADNNVNEVAITGVDVQSVSVDYEAPPPPPTNNFHKADGDGFFDIVLDFGDGGIQISSTTFTVTGAEIADFVDGTSLTQSVGGAKGSFTFAAHAQTTDFEGNTSDFIGGNPGTSVPDASVMFLLGSALIGLFGLSRRKVRK